MKLKERICNSLNTMNGDELKLLYEQIRLLESIKSASRKTREKIPIEKIHAMTASSKSLWSKSVIEEREDRI